MFSHGSQKFKFLFSAPFCTGAIFDKSLMVSWKIVIGATRRNCKNWAKIVLLFQHFFELRVWSYGHYGFDLAFLTRIRGVQLAHAVAFAPKRTFQRGVVTICIDDIALIYSHEPLFILPILDLNVRAARQAIFADALAQFENRVIAPLLSFRCRCCRSALLLSFLPSASSLRNIGQT